ncbi:MAG: hypothetical protein LBC46_01825, partial [Treponema sp.]|nr:hypothetical protein [Treponema sp.]
MSAALYNATKQCRSSELLANTPVAIAPDSIFRLDFAWDGPVPQAGQFFLIKPEHSSVFLVRPISVMGWDRLADSAVSGTITLGKFADGADAVSDAVTPDKFADGVVSDTIRFDDADAVSDTITPGKIADNAVSDTITPDKFADDADAVSGTVTLGKFADSAVSDTISFDDVDAVSDTITPDKFADDAVSGTIRFDDVDAVSDTITLDKFADDADAVSDTITPDKFADDAVSDTITPDKFADDAVSGTIRFDDADAVSDTIVLRFLIARRGTGTAELAQLRAGERAWLTGPLGNSWWDNDSAKVEAPIALIGGGIGIAPLVAFAREL